MLAGVSSGLGGYICCFSTLYSSLFKKKKKKKSKLRLNLMMVIGISGLIFDKNKRTSFKHPNIN